MTTTLDRLGFCTNPKAQKMLSKMGDNFPEKEKVILSMTLNKLYKRDKSKQKTLLITNKALYQLKQNYYRKYQRRIDIYKIWSITLSTKSTQFVVHISREENHRYSSSDVSIIIQTISEVYLKREGRKLAINKINEDSLLCVINIKNVYWLESREERLRRYQQFLGTINFDDEINDSKISTVTKELIKSTEKVQPNNFEFLEVIGDGLFGKVMLVIKMDSGELFAMKIIKNKHLITNNISERKLLKSLQHPFLMKIRFAFKTEAKLYFVLDYYRGDELFFHLEKKRRFYEKEAKFIIAEVSMAIGHLHSLDIVHRDIKSNNIMISPNGHICLTHFGVSKDFGVSQLSNIPGVTLEYLAPEVIMNLEYGKSSDWWSLGILLYELTVGILPFYMRSKSIKELYWKIKKAPILFPPNLSNECKSLVTQLLERDPKKRLGCGSNGVNDILSHKFFKSINMELLYAKKIIPPYKPSIRCSKSDNKQNYSIQSTEMVDTNPDDFKFTICLRSISYKKTYDVKTTDINSTSNYSDNEAKKKHQNRRRPNDIVSDKNSIVGYNKLKV